jgi:hypothetical protein
MKGECDSQNSWGLAGELKMDLNQGLFNNRVNSPQDCREIKLQTIGDHLAIAAQVITL